MEELQVVIIQPQDTGNKSHPYPHALVAGIERYPSQITRRMSKARQTKRSKVKPFIKVINYNHLMPTRYTLELEGLKGVVTADTFKEVSQREDAKKTVKKALEERYTSGKNRWFFTPLSTFYSVSCEVIYCTKLTALLQDFERFFCVTGSGWGYFKALVA
jgi:large subunit ribosomal protein L27e